MSTSERSATRLHLVRHGRVEARWAGRLYGDLDVALSEEGREQARRAAARLADRRLDAVVSSDLERARYGAAQIAGRQAAATGRTLEARAVADLREISRGAWAGRLTADLDTEEPGALEAWFAAPETTRPPQGESIADLRARVLPALASLVDAHPGGELAVVAHGWVIRATLGWVLGLPASELTRIHVPPASIATIDWHAEHLVGSGAGPSPSEGALRGPHRGSPNLVGIQVDRVAPDGRGWYRSPAKATS